MLKENYQLIYKWLVSAVVSNTSGSKAWRRLLVALVVLNIILFLGWQMKSIIYFIKEIEKIYGETRFVLKTDNDLYVTLYGPIMLAETVNSSATVSIRNEGNEILHDIHLALISKNGEIRVSNGESVLNSMDVPKLLPGEDYEHTFMLTPVRTLSTTIMTPTLNLYVSYSSGDPATVNSQKITDVYTFQISQFATLHRTVAQWQKVATGITITLMQLITHVQSLIGAVVAFFITPITLFIKPVRDHALKLIRWIENRDVQTGSQQDL